jgi:uncharacterized protein (TIGR02246 family)
MTSAQLAEYLAAWNDHDVDRIVELMTPDCSYHASVGPELLGQTATGREAVRAAVSAFFERLPDSRFEDVRAFVAGDRGAAEWTLAWTDAAGASQALRGCDLFEFSGDLVRTKNAFRKGRA